MSVTWIEASAGTGKTYTLVKTVVDLVVNRGLPVGKILLVTFTDKATAELKTRIRKGLRDAWKQTRDPRLAQALEDLPSLSISTIHGFCRALLTQFPLESGISFEPEMVDQGARWRRLLREEIRPRLADLDANLLAWAGLEEEEDILSLAGEALNLNLFALPLAHPDAPALALFARWRTELENLTGSLGEMVSSLAELRLPEDSRQGLGAAVDAFLHARNHVKPYQAVRRLTLVRTFRDWPGVLDPETIELLEKWDDGGSLWKKAAQPPFEGNLEAVRTGALRFAAEVRRLESALPSGVPLGAFLKRAARYEVLAGLCGPVLQKRSDRELTYHDLIDRVRTLVTSGSSRLAEGASARWNAVLIDEFQDTDPEQWAIFSSLFLDADHDLVLVGDPKQSIYRFRGADLAVYRRVREDIRTRNGTFAVLEENFRSTAPMIAAVNALFDPATAPWDHPDDYHPSRKGQKPIPTLVRRGPGKDTEEVPPLERRSAATEQDWHRHLVRTVLGLLDGTHLLQTPGGESVPVSPADVLILVRRKAEAWTLYRLLTAKGIPATVGGSGGLLQGREAREVLLFLKALENPRSLSSARALSWTRFFAGAPVDRLAPALDAATPDRDRGAFLRAFRRVAAALEPEVTDGGGFEALLGLPGGARTVTNAEHVLELVQERYHAGKVAPGKAALALETWIASGLQEDEVDLRRAGETPTVRLMTIHASKGLEAPVVLHGWVTDPPARDPHWFVGAGVDFLLTAEGREREARAQAAEDLRLRYVALTRARCHQVLLDPAAPAVEPLTGPGWAALAPWTGTKEARPPVPVLAHPIEGLAVRHPWVESHSGLWRRASRDDRTEWDRPRIGRDDEAAGTEAALGDELPAGAAFGDLVHDLLEAADWTAWAPGAPAEAAANLAALTAAHCQRHRSSFGGRDLSRPLGLWLARVLSRPLDLGPGTPPVVFASLGPEETRRELEFHVPLGLTKTAQFSWGGREFALHPGFLTGRIDLLFRWHGRLYLADWKTNRLAPGQEPADLMSEAGYDLQAQWYWEALKRLCRIQNEPQEPGGILYVFLRGPDDSPLGVFLSPERLDAERTLAAHFSEALRD